MPGPNAAPSAYLINALRKQVSGCEAANDIFGDRVPAGTSVSRRFQARPYPPSSRLCVIKQPSAFMPPTRRSPPLG
jgi:hypothetical protein